jgi:glycerophosphoryl diester phosphodiesterase
MMPMTDMPMPLLIAHRGASREAPENTLAAFARAWDEGADGIEADFRLTRDGHVVCLHDATTSRTAGAAISVADATLAALRRLDLGAGERIPTLAEVLAQLPAGKRFFIELKSGPEIIAPLARVLAASGVASGQLRLLAFDAQLVARLRTELPGIGACLNTAYRFSPLTGTWRPSRTELLATLTRIGAAGLSSQARAVLDAEFVAELRRQGKEIHVWTVDAPRRARHYQSLGVDSLMTNRPGWLRRQLLEAGRRGAGREA